MAQKPDKTSSKSGDMRKSAGAGPSLAAHSKDSKTSSKSGQSAKASGKKK